MLPDLTPAVARALQAAQQTARRLGAVAVEPEHLLHGLLQEEEGRASALLARAGLDTAAIRLTLAERPPAGPPHATEPPLPFSPEFEKILTRARRLAGELSADPTVGSAPLLLELLRAEEDVRNQLQARGLNLAKLEAEILSEQGPPLELEEPLRLTDPKEVIDTARIIDAAANRAREGLRVVEDYCRFALDDAFLGKELKTLRHHLTTALADLPSRLLLEARETRRDVGTFLSTATEGERASPTAVVLANLKRLQEALRTLEEFGKLQGSAMGKAVEQLRYRTYTLERAIILGATARQRLQDARLCVLLTGSLCAGPLESTIQEAAAGGASLFQLREKNLSDRELLDRARRVRTWTQKAGALFIVNDRPDVARLVEADGVHLGQNDLPVQEARRIMGPDALIGVSTHTLDQVREAVLDGASYLGLGPTFPSGTKAFTEFPGLDFIRQAAAETALPAFAIGGITPANVGEAYAAGARRVAVSQAICASEAPRAVAMELLRKLA